MEQVYRNIIEIPERGYHYFRHFFIPHEGNNHQPLAIRPPALKVYSLILILVKLALTGFLYTVYPTEAHFAELTVAKILELTNQSRAAEGLPALSLNPKLAQAAQAKGQDMLGKNYFEHTAPDGKKFWQWIKESGYSYTTAGENLAMDFTTAESAHDALFASESHRRNIIKPNYTEIGLAVLEGSLTGRETTVLVEMFGAPSATTTLVSTQPTQAPTAPSPPPPAPTPQPASPTITELSKPESPPTYISEYLGRSHERLSLISNTSVRVWVDFKNTGTATWYRDAKHFVALNVSEPAGRASAVADESWPASYRPALLEQQRVRPGETNRFSFTLKASGPTGDFRESFALVSENLTWIEGGTVTIPVKVLEPILAQAPPPPAQVVETPVSETPQDVVEATFNTTAVTVVQAETGTDIQPSLAEPIPLVVQHLANGRSDWQRLAVDWTVRFFWAFLIFLTAALALNILIKFRIQHGHVILQTLVVIGLTAFLALVKLHFAERLSNLLIA